MEQTNKHYSNKCHKIANSQRTFCFMLFHVQLTELQSLAARA